MIQLNIISNSIVRKELTPIRLLLKSFAIYSIYFAIYSSAEGEKRRPEMRLLFASYPNCHCERNLVCSELNRIYLSICHKYASIKFRPSEGSVLSKRHL